MKTVFVIFCHVLSVGLAIDVGWTISESIQHGTDVNWADMATQLGASFGAFAMQRSLTFEAP